MLNKVSENLEAPKEVILEPMPKRPNKLTKHFSLIEFACNDEANTPVPDEYYDNVLELAKNLEVLREECGGKPIVITSGYRTVEYNKKVGGVKTSQHLVGKAADIKIKGMSPAKVADKVRALMKAGKMKKGGIGTYKTFTHIDIRGKMASWSG